jgi:hypothetical protein
MSIKLGQFVNTYQPTNEDIKDYCQYAPKIGFVFQYYNMDNDFVSGYVSMLKIDGSNKFKCSKYSISATAEDDPFDDT